MTTDWLDVQEGSPPVMALDPLSWALRVTADGLAKKHIAVSIATEEDFFVRGVLAKRFASYLPCDNDLHHYLEACDLNHIDARLKTLMMSGRFGAYSLNESDLVTLARAVFTRLPDEKLRELRLAHLLDLHDLIYER